MDMYSKYVQIQEGGCFKVYLFSFDMICLRCQSKIHCDLSHVAEIIRQHQSRDSESHLSDFSPVRIRTYNSRCNVNKMGRHAWYITHQQGEKKAEEASLRTYWDMVQNKATLSLPLTSQPSALVLMRGARAVYLCGTPWYAFFA